MEKNFYHNDFEEFLKVKADQYKMYPSDRVWKGIDKSIRSRRRWYWSGFVLLLSGISYFAITELVAPTPLKEIPKIQSAPQPKPTVTTKQLVPFSSAFYNEKTQRTLPILMRTLFQI